jgi:hypothetical protein
MQVRIYGQRKMQTLRDIASASGQQNNALRLAQLAGKIDGIDFAGSGHFLGHLGQIVTLILSLNPTQRVHGVRPILALPIYIYLFFKV